LLQILKVNTVYLQYVLIAYSLYENSSIFDGDCDCAKSSKPGWWALSSGKVVTP
jgi:hypothetical protein